MAELSESLKSSAVRLVPEEYGFQEKVFETVGLFELKPVSFPSLPLEQRTRLLKVSQHSFVLLSEAGNLFRWRPKLDTIWQELNFPQSKLDEGLTTSVVGGFKDLGKKILFIGSAKKEN